MLLRVEVAFRADEAAEVGLERVKRYLIPRSLTADERQQAERALADVVATCGPVVGGYPSWHPLVAKSLKASDQVTIPSERCGYRGLDHTVYFAHGFVTCPYGDGEEVVRSANNIVGPKNIYVTAEAIDAPFYSSGTTPILVKCEWMADLEDGFTIPKSLAVPLMLEKEVPAWRWSEVGETWENMRSYLLGSPHGARSSLFVTQDTALAMKRIYEAMVNSGMYGPIYN
ncbi:hypothetical protein [Xanthobacter variabilis]